MKEQHSSSIPRNVTDHVNRWRTALKNGLVSDIPSTEHNMCIHHFMLWGTKMENVPPDVFTMITADFLPGATPQNAVTWGSCNADHHG
jgi:hypothetical protein